MIYTKKFGQPTKGHVIIVHGLGEHFRRHRRLIKRLKKEGYKIHTFDWPGHGKSSGKRGHARIDNTLKIIDEQIKDIDGKPFLFGHSLGGLTVLRYSEENSNKIKSVISSSPPLERSDEVSFFNVKMVSLLSYFFPKKTMSNSFKVEDVTRSKEGRKNYMEDKMVHDKASLRLLSDLFKNMKIAHQRKEKLNCPVLLLGGTEDKICPVEGAEKFVEDLQVKEKDLIKYKGAYHEIFNDPEWKEDFHEDIMDWIKDHS